MHYATASGTLSSVWLLIAIPLASAAILLLLGRRADRWGHWLGVGSVFVAFILGLVYFFALRGLPAGPGSYRGADRTLFTFLEVGKLKVTFGLLFDPLSAIFVMFAAFGSVSFSDVFGAVGGAGSTTVLMLGLLLLLGACGKSGQFPLQAWLPDAMEGPTPVSALIHAATMVTAGVYLIARSNPIFSANPTAQTVVVAVGAATLLIGAIIGCAKDDIKRVLAWSTVSQIGYMFLGVGLGGVAYALALIHLLAHGFFKAGLFLGAGSVMHAMNDQTDIRRFGGLWRYLKITWITFGLAWLAILGIPPLSGFFSKDPIIEAAFN